MKLTLIAFFIMALFFQNCGPELINTADLPSKGGGPNTVTKIVLPPNSFDVVLGDRYYITSVFEDVFLIQDVLTVESITISDIIKNDVFFKQQEFGGYCNIHDETAYGCSGNFNQTEYLNFKTYGFSSSPREGFRTKACYKILDLDLAVENAVFNAGLTLDAEVSTENMYDIYDLFYPGQEADLTIINAIHDVAVKAKNSGSSIDAWRYALLTVCLSPGWQIQ